MPDVPKLPHVVILGGGFAGIYAARGLRRAPARVTLIDRRNHHIFFPLLYQVATAGLSPGDIAAPIRRILRRQPNTTVLMAQAESIDVAARQVRVEGDVLDYDYLVLAAGSTSSYFGHQDWAASAPALMSLEGALEIRRRMLSAYEQAEREPDPGQRAGWLTMVVVGGGPTGVEMAGAMAEMARHTLARDFRRIDPRRTRLLMLEGQDRVLPMFDAKLSAKARAALERLGVEVRTGTRVTGIDDTGVAIGDERIPARTVIWAAGVAVSPLARSLGVPLDRSGRVLVEPDLSIPGHPEVFVAGDLAAARRGEGFVAPLAQPAIQMGRHAARGIARLLRGEPTRPFRYFDLGTMATIGRASAVADFGRVKFSGYPAWLAWLTIHIFWLIGFSNRVLVLFQWAWAYFTWDRSARLVTGPVGAGRGSAPSS